MTAGKNFKLRIRYRMEQTGESYTAAKRALEALREQHNKHTNVIGPQPPPVMAGPDDR